MISKYTQICPVTFGRGAVGKTGELVKGCGLSRVLVVSDKGVIAAGHTERAIRALNTADVETVLFDEVEMDAPDFTITRGAEKGLAEGVDGVVGVGGGSSLDSAKAIALLMANPDADIYKLIRFDPANPFHAAPALPTVMVPTTSGTGSEVTFVAVIEDTERRVKSGCLIFPKQAVLDPELTLTVPKDVTAYTGMDAFSHASEALASVGINPHSDLLAMDAIRRIIRWLPVAVEEPDNYEARENLALAANFAGKAFQDSTVNVGHSIAHALGAAFTIPHGIGCALATPVVEERVASSRPETFSEIARLLGAEDVKLEDPELGRKLGDALRGFLRKVGIPSLSELHVTREMCISLTERVASDRMRFACSVQLSPEDIAQMMADVYDKY